MLTEKFDAYGEVLPDAAGGQPEAASGASSMLARAGQYAFWLLVVVIVSVPDSGTAVICHFPATSASASAGGGAGAGAGAAAAAAAAALLSVAA